MIWPFPLRSTSIPEKISMKHTEGTHFIGITGGVGAGKSRVLRYLKETVSCRIIYADEEALKFYVPGNDIFGKIIEAVGEDVLDGAGGIDKRKMAAKIFSDDKLLQRVNDIVHNSNVSTISFTVYHLIFEDPSFTTIS